VLVDEIAREMRVYVAEDRVTLDKRGHASAGSHYRIGRIDGVAESAGVTEVVAGRHARSVGHSESREQRMWVGEIHTFGADRGHGRRGLRCYRQRQWAVRYEQDEVALVLRFRWRELKNNNGTRR